MCWKRNQDRAIEMADFILKGWWKHLKLRARGGEGMRQAADTWAKGEAPRQDWARN